MCIAIRRAAFVVLLVLSAWGRGASPLLAQVAGGGSLHQVDWTQVLHNDPQIRVSTECIGGSFVPEHLGPCITVPLDLPIVVRNEGDAPRGSFTGYAATAPGDVLYGDLDGDGIDEAVIRTESTGTGGSFGFLVYQQHVTGPRLAAIVPGYRLGVRIEGNQLVASQPFYFAFDGNCCPTASTQTTYRLSATGVEPAAAPALFLLSEDGEQRAGAAEITVAAFYRALGRREFQGAYALLSPATQALKPFDEFAAGYEMTESISVAVAPGASPAEVSVQLVAVDRLPGGRTVSQRFAGSWFVVEGATAPLGVYLDHAIIRTVMGDA